MTLQMKCAETVEIDQVDVDAILQSRGLQSRTAIRQLHRLTAVIDDPSQLTKIVMKMSLIC